MQENIVDPDLREWVMPDFTTTNVTDKVVASVVFMGAMSHYFDYDSGTGWYSLRYFNLCSSIRFKRLLSSTEYPNRGEKKDWEVILSKIEKIPSLGEEHRQWHQLLVPVIKRFVTCFAEPHTMAGFWQTILHHIEGGSGQPESYSGWLNAFLFWTDEGECLKQKYDNEEKDWDYYLDLKDEGILYLDDVAFLEVAADDVAFGWTTVDVQIDDTYNGHVKYMTTMMAGSVG